jgi:hypothetical protein
MTATNSRRSFFKKALQFATLGAAASTGVYLIGSAFKELDGSLTAGAKTGYWQFAPFGSCPYYTTYNSCSACGINPGQPCSGSADTCSLDWNAPWCEIGGSSGPPISNCLECVMPF